MLNWRDPENPLAGGAESVTLGYLSDLVRRGHEVFWLTHSFDGAPPYTEINGIRIHRLGNLLKSRVTAPLWVKKHAPIDLIIDQHHGIPWLSPLWAKGNSISFIHEVLGPIWYTFYPFPLASLGVLQERLTIHLYRNHRFWTSCRSTEKQLSELGVKSIVRIPYGVELVPFSDLPVKNLENQIKLVMVSRLAPNKRIDHGLKALRILLDRGLNFSLTVIGVGQSGDSLKKSAQDLKLEDYCQFTGHVSEDAKCRLLGEAHLLLHCSVREGWGLNVIEANAFGTPAVVYPVPGLIDSTIDQVTGYVTSFESPESLADKIIEVLNNPVAYSRIRLNAWTSTQDHLWKNVVKKSSPFLESCVKQPTE